MCAEDTDEDMKEVKEVKESHAEEKTALPISGETVASATKSPETQQLIFVLVGMGEEKRQHYSKVVEELGATVTLCHTFNPEVTHLVAESLSRSERTLAAIASGKWVLHDSYLDHSHRAGHFLKVGGKLFGALCCIGVHKEVVACIIESMKKLAIICKYLINVQPTVFTFFIKTL